MRSRTHKACRSRCRRHGLALPVAASGALGATATRRAIGSIPAAPSAGFAATSHHSPSGAGEARNALNNGVPMKSASDRYAYPTASAGASTPLPAVVHQHFTVAREAVNAQALAWSDYVGRILDSPVSRSQVASGFHGEIDAYVLPDMIYLDSRTDPLIQARTGGRISTDAMRDFVFHVAVHGMMETGVGGGRSHSTQFMPGILALDMGQPMRMVRPTRARVLAFFVPRDLVESEIADAPSIHGRVVGYASPLGRLILGHLSTLCRHLPSMPAHEAASTIRTCAHLIIAAFGKQAQLSHRARTAARSALQSQVCRYVQANLHNSDLSPESVLRRFALPRTALYRMFEAEGGLATYVRHCRLWEAAGDLVRQPDMAVVEIGYGLGFNSASDFSRAFRRAFGMPPQEFRALRFDMGERGAP